MRSQVRIDDIITSESTLEDQEEAFLLGLYYAIDSEDKFYHYAGPIDNTYVVQLVELYINNFAYLKVFSAEMYTSIPLHVARYRQPAGNINSTLLAYYNGAVSLDQSSDSKVDVHIWIEKKTADNLEIIKPEDFTNLILNMPL